MIIPPNNNDVMNAPNPKKSRLEKWPYQARPPKTNAVIPNDIARTSPDKAINTGEIIAPIAIE